MPELQKANHTVSLCTAEFRDSIRGLEHAVIEAAMEWWNHSLAEPQRLILLRTIDALIAARETALMDGFLETRGQ